MKRYCWLSLLLMVIACTHPADNTSQPKPDDLQDDSIDQAAAAPKSPSIEGSKVDAHRLNGFLVEVWKSSPERPFEFAFVSRGSDGSILDQIGICGDCGVAAAEGGYFETGEYFFLDDDRLEITQHGIMMMDAHALDITMSEAEETEERLGWDNPYAVLERNFDSLTTTRYQLTSNGSFDMMAGYPIKTLVEEHWAGLGYFDGLPSSNLRILRNAIYAHYGMRFKSNDLKEYFSKKDYYKPQYDNVEKMLTPLDKSLITYLKALEDQ